MSTERRRESFCDDCPHRAFEHLPPATAPIAYGGRVGAEHASARTVPWEDIARDRKVTRIARALSATGRGYGDVAAWSPGEWVEFCSSQGIRRPSPKTRAAVLERLSHPTGAAA